MGSAHGLRWGYGDRPWNLQTRAGFGGPRIGKASWRPSWRILVRGMSLKAPAVRPALGGDVLDGPEDE